VRNAIDGVDVLQRWSRSRCFVFMGEMLFQSRLAIKAIDAVKPDDRTRAGGALAVVAIVCGNDLLGDLRLYRRDKR